MAVQATMDQAADARALGTIQRHLTRRMRDIALGIVNAADARKLTDGVDLQYIDIELRLLESVVRIAYASNGAADTARLWALLRRTVDAALSCCYASSIECLCNALDAPSDGSDQATRRDKIAAILVSYLVD